MSTDAHEHSGVQPTSNADVVELPLARILIDPALQPRVKGIDDAHLVLLGDVLDELPPVKVVETAGGFVLVGGHHTLCAYQNAGRTTIRAQVLDLPEDGDLLALAFHENAKFGLAYTREDRDAFVAHLLRLHPERSEREISREAGRPQPVVARIRRELEASAQIEQTDVRVGRGGYTYTVMHEKSRQPGELARDKEPLSDRLFTAKERRAQGRVARYAVRVADALEDQFDMPCWQTAGQAAEACRLVFGNEKALQLAERLGVAASGILDLATELGYEDDAEDAE